MLEKFCLLLTLCFSTLISFSQNIPFTIKGKVGSYDAPAKVFLYYENPQRIDTAKILHGEFIFKGSIQTPGKAALILDHTGNGLSIPKEKDILNPIILEKGTISVNSPDSMKNATVGGTSSNVGMQMLKEMFTQLMKESQEIYQNYTIASDSLKSSDNFVQSINKKMIAVKERLNQNLKIFIKNQRENMSGLEALNIYMNQNKGATDLESLFNELSSDVKKTDAGKKVYMAILRSKIIDIGSLAVDFEQKDTAGKTVKLSDFRGKYVLLDFWASWCGPCRRESPVLREAYQTFKDKGFTILGVSLDENKRDWLKAIEEDGLGWTHVSDLEGWKGEVSKTYGIRSIPSNYLIDPQGKIVAKNLRGRELKRNLEHLLSK